MEAGFVIGMERKAMTLPTRGWSGSSMLEGISKLSDNTIVKRELPESEAELEKLVQARS